MEIVKERRTDAIARAMGGTIRRDLSIGNSRTESDPKTVPADKILSLCARGMTTREIQLHLRQAYCVEVSRAVILNVTDAVWHEVRNLHGRPLEPICGILFLDALCMRMRHQGRFENRAVYVAIGIDMGGGKDVLGLWAGVNEDSRFWLEALKELKRRGMRDVLIASIYGRKGLPEAIGSAFPETRVQLCIMQILRASLNYVNWRERRHVAADLKAIYRAATELQAERELREFIGKWGCKYQAIVRLWKDNWEQVMLFFELPPDLRRVICDANVVESLQVGLHRTVKSWGSFASEETAVQVLHLALRNVITKSEKIQHCEQALNQLKMLEK